MSTWICKALIACSFLGLAACDGGIGVSRNAPDRILLPDGIVVAGAAGWCVDVGNSRAGEDTAVVVLGSCAAIAKNDRAPRPNVPGVLTVAVEGPGLQAPAVATLEAFFETEDGLAVLARDGNGAHVRLLESRREGEVLFLHAEDSSALPGVARDYWRVLFGLNGRLISVTLLGISGRPIDQTDGLATLHSQIEELIAANDA